jgi:hypothetical protein
LLSENWYPENIAVQIDKQSAITAIVLGFDEASSLAIVSACLPLTKSMAGA